MAVEDLLLVGGYFQERQRKEGEREIEIRMVGNYCLALVNCTAIGMRIDREEQVDNDRIRKVLNAMRNISKS